MLIKRIFHFLLIIFLFFTSSFLSSPYAFAQQNETPQSKLSAPQQIQKNIIDFSAALICQISGRDPLDQTQGCVVPQIQNGKLTYTIEKDNSHGIFGFLASAVNAMYQIPISSLDYVSYLHSSFGLAHNVYADSIGLTSIKPLLNIWIVFRNISLSFFILLTLIVGLLIMIRIKIDQRTFIGLENQLPKIIITLLFINFSFAISGFLIDLMHVADNIVYNTLNQIQPIPGLNPIVLIDNNVTPIGAIDSFGTSCARVGPINGCSPIVLASQLADSIYPDVTNALSINTNPATSTIATMFGSTGFLPGQIALGLGRMAGGASPFDVMIDWITYSISDALAQWFGQIAGLAPIAGTSPNVLGSIVMRGSIDAGLVGLLDPLIRWQGIRLFLILLIYLALIIGMLRIFVNLLTSFISIIFNIVLSPIAILTGLIPGNAEGGFVPWIKGMCADLLIFPATLGMLHLTADIAHAMSGTIGFHPPLLPSDFSATGLGALAEFGGLMATGFIKAPIDKAFGRKDNPLIGQTLGAALIGTTLLQKSFSGMNNVSKLRKIKFRNGKNFDTVEAGGNALDAFLG